MLTAFWWDAGVQFVRLDHFALNFPPNTRYALVGVTHLHISSLKATDIHRSHFTELLQFPSLTHVVLNEPTRWHNLPSKRIIFVGLQALAPQLTTITLLEYDPFYAHAVAPGASEFTNLRMLVLASPAETWWKPSLARILRALPPALITLDISAQPLSVGFARAVGDSFEGEWGSVSRLRVVRLPSETGLVVQAGHAVSAGVEQLRRVAELAQARGVRVEWV